MISLILKEQQIWVPDKARVIQNLPGFLSYYHFWEINLILTSFLTHYFKYIWSWDCFWSHVLENCEQTDPYAEVFFFSIIEKISYKKDNSSKNTVGKEHFRLDLSIYLPETSEKKSRKHWRILNINSFVYCSVLVLKKNVF